MLTLTPQELYDITGRHNRRRQIEELNRLGIDHRVRHDGMPIVSRRAAERALGGEARNDASPEPDYGAVWG